MQIKTKNLNKNYLVKNTLDGKYYPLDNVTRRGLGYIVTLVPAHLDGNTYYAEYNDLHFVQTH